MPRYLIVRPLGKVTDEQLAGAARKSERVRKEAFPDIVWEHSHVLRRGDELTTYCIYEATDPERVREHAAAAGLPVDAIDVIHTDIDPKTM